MVHADARDIVKDIKKDVIMVGGGAAGFFAAITCAEKNRGLKIAILEAGRRPLEKVRISGGGRCNVTHACFDPAELVRSYPRGEKALRGPFSRFQPRDVMDWFESRGVRLKIEDDGRVFPVTDDSATIIDCLMGAARKAGVELILNQPVTSITRGDDGFQIQGRGDFRARCERLLMATGGAPAGFRMAAELGHAMVPSRPSLFTFQVRDDRIRDLAGISVPRVRVKLPGAKDKAAKASQEGPLLITHTGLSGPAVLRLSAWGARELAERRYTSGLLIHWTPAYNEEQLREKLRKVKVARGAKRVSSPLDEFDLPRRLWRNLTMAAGIETELTWSELDSKRLNRLVKELHAGEFEIRGKGVFKEEFVTAGGVDLKEVDFRAMESRRLPGLHFAGELLDIDGITGGFNFQNAWTTAYIAGTAMAS